MGNCCEKNRRIAILSMQRVLNFGSVLQAYSLREVIKEVTGASVAFLDIEDVPVCESKRSVPDSVDYNTPADYLSGFFQRGKRWLIARMSAYNKRLIRKFMREELKLDCKSDVDRYDCIVVGSDEVFNHKKGIRLHLHGDIKNADIRITYAASCGSAVAEDIDPKDLDLVRSAMGNYSAMSVRDAATKNYVSSLYDGEIQHHLDPVLIGDLYKREHKPVRMKNYLLVYAYGQRIRTAEEIQTIRTFAKDRNLKVVAMGGSQFWCDFYVPASPFRLLDYFYFADYIVTDTFHGTIFSVINRKKFGVISRKTNWKKLDGLLRDLHLEKRLINRMEDLEAVLTENIDYDEVESILAGERIRTREYLKEQLGGSF